MAGAIAKLMRPESLYYVWQIGWAIGGACLLWRSRRALKAEPDARTAWSGRPEAVAAYLVVYLLFAFLVLPGAANGLALSIQPLAPDAEGLDFALRMLFTPLLVSIMLLGLRRFAPEFSPQRPHRVKPAGDFGFTPFGILRGFSGAMALVGVTALIWGAFLLLLKAVKMGDYLQSQNTLKFLSGANDWRVLVPFTLGAVVFAPINEELFYRGGLFAILRNMFPRFGAYALCGAIFAAVHLSVFAFLPLFVFGAWLAYLYDTTADIRVPVTVHALFNLSSVVWTILVPTAVL